MTSSGRIAVLLRDDDTSALTPPAYLETIYRPLWEMGFPVSLGVVPELMGSKNLNIPPNERGSGKIYPLTKDSPVFPLLKKGQVEGLIEVLQHGRYHTTNLELLYPEFGSRDGYMRDLLSASSEFYGLASDKIQEDIRAGKAHLEKLFERPVTGFIAPQEYMKPALWKTLNAEGFTTYSGGIRPDYWDQLGLRSVRIPALARLGMAVLRRTPLSELGEYVQNLTTLPIIPATYRHYWSGHDTPELSAKTLAMAKAIFTKKYDRGGGYFLVLTHYWEYFGDWQSGVTQNHQLDAMHELFRFINQHAEVEKLSLSQYVASRSQF